MRTRLKAPVSRTFTALPTSWLWPSGPPIWQISTLGAAVALTSVAVPALPTVLPDKPAPAHTRAAPATDDSGRIGGTVSGGDPGSPGSPGASGASGADPAAVPTVTAVSATPTSGAAPSETPHATGTATPTAGPAATGVPTPSATDSTPATTSSPIGGIDGTDGTDPAAGPVTLAASDPGNQRFLASTTACPTCVSGSRVIGLGLLATLTVPVQVDAAGRRQLTIAYETKRERDLYVSVNGGPSQKITVAGTGGWETPGRTSVTVELTQGENKIKFHNPLGLAPDLDQITLG